MVAVVLRVHLCHRRGFLVLAGRELASQCRRLMMSMRCRWRKLSRDDVMELMRLERFLNQLVTVYSTPSRVLLDGRDPWFAVLEPLLRTSLTRTFLGETRPEGVPTKKECCLGDAIERGSRNSTFISELTQLAVQRHLLLIVSTGAE